MPGAGDCHSTIGVRSDSVKRVCPASVSFDSTMTLAAEPAATATGSAGPAVRAAGLVKAFGPIRAVDDVSFDLAPGRIYGVLGPNGSGKTTLIRLLVGLTRATAGHAEVLGVAMPSRPTLGRIGYMTQSDGIYPALTVGRERPVLRRGLRRRRVRRR